MARPRAVIFDWGGTLTLPLETHYYLNEVWTAAAEHMSPERAEEIARHLGVLEAEVWELSRTEHKSSRMTDLLRSAAEEFRLELAETALEEAELKHLEGLTEHITHDPDAASVLEALRERDLKIGLLSNTTWPADFHERLLTEAGLIDLIDARVYTSELEVTKPHEESFAAVMRLLGVSATESVFVGDRPWDDIYGAKRAGLRAVLRPNPMVPDHEVEPDATIETLPDLLPLIEAWSRE
ncbi:MAG: putative hydrolase of the superfamily [Actinomycetota bacterium]|jgi:putative hydrolase of the HAD superfamily|nr:putative hydrolase of the superfamily [Actinomycetota bacterium]